MNATVISQQPCNVLQFQPVGIQATQGGVTHAQAMEVHERYFARLQAVPTIAHQMEINYEVACKVMGGSLWPGVRQYWMDRVLP